MAQAVAMGPPLSPRETRRSGRRSAPSASASTSKSPDSDQPPRQKDIPIRTSNPASNSHPRSKRLKQEDLDEGVDDRRNASSTHSNSSGASNNGASNGKPKRKQRDKDKTASVVDTPDDPDPSIPDEPTEEEEQGITRCVCGSAEDDPDAGEFMVQCETCKVWQHGLCMGFHSEDQVHDDDYYCEQCRPDLHVELVKKLSKRARQSSAASHHTAATAPSRVSRSHSPSYLLKQPSKRRNTMNSRDAAFDESIKEIIEATAAEAAAVQDVPASTDPSKPALEPEDGAEGEPTERRKRKRVEDDPITTAKKRTRSASSVSDRQGSAGARADTPVSAGQSKPPISAPAQSTRGTGRSKRGGRKGAVVVAADIVNQPVEGEEGVPPASTKRQAGRTKGSSNLKRPPLSHVGSHGPGSASHEHGTRRHQSSSGANGQSNVVESSRSYRNSHAYAASQQPLFTSWGLPDYLAHLEPMLPTNTPQPLEVLGGRGDSVERTTERGVKVKWPSKRMSVGDMNKRVRALVEWVGREQASALDRDRRKDALDKAIAEETADALGRSAVDGDGDVMMAPESESGPGPQISHEKSEGNSQSFQEGQKSTMKMMEELMEELIGFQERFGPGAKNRERERRLAAAAAGS